MRILSIIYSTTYGDKLQYYYDLGFSRADTIAKVSQDLNLTQEKMLKIMKQYLLNKNKVKQTSSGEYYLR